MGCGPAKAKAYRPVHGQSEAVVEPPCAVRKDYGLKWLRAEVQGHRGYGFLEPENSLKAMKAAAGDPLVSSVEFDVVSTKDDVLVVWHGPEFAGKEKRDCPTYAELQQRDIGEGERVPLFKDVANFCAQNGVRMNIEIKPGEDRTVTQRVVSQIQRLNLTAITQISSLDRKVLKDVIAIAPNFPVGAIYMNGRPKDPNDPNSPVVYDLPPKDWVTWFKSHHVLGDFVALRAQGILEHPNYICEARRYGKLVVVWFPNTPNEGFEENRDLYSRIMALGVQGMIINRPDIIRSMYGWT